MFPRQLDLEFDLCKRGVDAIHSSNYPMETNIKIEKALKYLVATSNDSVSLLKRVSSYCKPLSDGRMYWVDELLNGKAQLDGVKAPVGYDLKAATKLVDDALSAGVAQQAREANSLEDFIQDAAISQFVYSFGRYS
jgi:hypothetical protein